MVINGTINYKKALVFNESRIRELMDMLLRYCNSFVIEGKTKDARHIKFDTLDELLKYDNSDNNSICELELSAYNGFSRNVYIFISKDVEPTFLLNYSKTVNCRYSFETEQCENDFDLSFKKLLKKCKAPYWIFSKISLKSVVLVPLWLISLWEILFYNRQIDFTAITAKSYIIITFITIAAYYIVRIIDRWLMNNLFPPIVFAFGEEEKRYEKIQKRREYILWCVIVAAIIAIGVQLLDKII